MIVCAEMRWPRITVVIACAILAGVITASLFHAPSVRAAAIPVDNSTAAQGNDNLTWSHDIAPVLYKNCVSCHHPGGAGPFSLLTYADAKRWGAQVVKVTQSRYMPPWLPEPGHGDFADVRRLGDADLAKLHTWFQAGMPEGNPLDAPKAPTYDSTWQMGKPDLILKQARPFTLPAGGTDVFRNFILPYPLKASHFIRAMEIRPGAAQVVHHANVLIDRTASYRHQHSDDWQNGVSGMEILLDAGNTFDPDSHFLFWKPDTPALIEPEGMPWRLDPGSDLILNIHLKPSGKSEVIDAEIGLYFTDQPPTKQPMLLQLDRDDALDIPPGDTRFVVEDSMTLPVDVEALGVYPHAHYLGKDMQAWAILPNGTKQWLVWIRDWDIDRQSVYRYREPLQLPKGTVLHMRFLYDNSAGNPRNPHNPAVRVRAGNRSEDEMAHLWLQVLPVHANPSGPDPRLQLEEAWMRNRLGKTPGDRVSRYNLGAALAGEGRYKEAIEVYEKDRRAYPDDPRTLTALGAALEGEGDWRQAMERYRQAVAASNQASSSASCDARFDLALLEQKQEQYTEAARDFQTQLSSCTEDAETHSGLGAALAGLGQAEAAQVEFHRALELDAGDFTSHFNLGEQALAAGPLQQAVQQLEAAAARKPGSAEVHQRLAQAYGASGRVEDAIAQLRLAAKQSPETAEIHSLLSQALDATGKADEALAEARLAVKLNANDADGWNNLGVLEARARHIDDARSDFEHALKIQPDHAQARANLARLSPAH
jgi:tetratricopeptide (TPR) repeat protein/mono/diheme cytochrome c family protein